MAQRIGQLSRISISALAAVAAVAALCLTGCGQQQSRGALASVDSAQKLREALGSGVTDKNGGKPKQERTGWATLKGTITVAGDPPDRPFYNIDKNLDICAPGGKKALAETVIVDPQTKGLANVFFYAADLKAADDMVHPDMIGAGTDEILFDQKRCAFIPHALVVDAKQTLKIRNSDGTPHNTKFATGQDRTVQPAALEALVFGRRAKEPIEVSCSFHLWMRAYVLPLDNLYGAVAGTDGSFEINDLPAGVDLRIQLWHEHLKKKFPAASVTVDGQPATLKRGRLSLKLEPSKTTLVKIELPASAFE